MPSIIQQLCDVCYTTDSLVEAKPITATIDGKERTVLLCDVHDKELVQPIRDVLLEHGVKPVTAPPPSRFTPGTTPLPNGLTPERASELVEAGTCVYECGYQAALDAKTPPRTNVGTHLRQQHRTSLHALGLNKPSGRVTRAQGEYACREADCGKVFTTAQGKAVHEYRTHGIRSESKNAERHRADSATNPDPVAVAAMRSRREFLKPNGKLGCPSCTREFQSLRALNGHRNREHGYVSAQSGADRKRRSRAAAKAAEPTRKAG